MGQTGQADDGLSSSRIMTPKSPSPVQHKFDAQWSYTPTMYIKNSACQWPVDIILIINHTTADEQGKMQSRNHGPIDVVKNNKGYRRKMVGL